MRWIIAWVWVCIGWSLPLMAGEVDCYEILSAGAGDVMGDADRDTATCSWKGIPYAAPPVGGLRFKAPAPVPRWSGVRDARRFTPRCMQRGAMELVNFDPSGEMSEDCLYLHVWRPRAKGRFPVMVWIHGGGFFGGTANTPMYHGQRLAEREQVVVVSVNYRLNVFGFMALPALSAEDPDHSSGNYALLDQIAALRWVKDNVATFGGDPERVTLAGESAGGWSVCSLMASPLGRGLFHRAIMESGGCQAATDQLSGYDAGQQAAAALGCDGGDLECLRAVDARTLLRRAVEFELRGFKWLPRVDGHVLTQRPWRTLVAGAFNNVPFLAGANKDEVKVAPYLIPGALLDPAFRYQERLDRAYTPRLADDIAAAYPLSEWGRPARAYARIYTESALVCPSVDGLTAAARHQRQAWLYRFDYHRYRFGAIAGAAHGMELPYVFDTVDAWPLRPLYGGRHQRRARPLIDVVQAYWGNFIRTGDPNGRDLPTWPSYDPQGRRVQVLDRPISTSHLSEELLGRCEVWRELWQSNPWLSETLGFPQGRRARGEL